MAKIRVLQVKAGQRPEVVEIDNGLDGMQSLVGGYIECLGLRGGIDLWLNEEGAIHNQPVNFLVPGRAPLPPEDVSFVIYAHPDLAKPGELGVHVIHGDVFFARHDDEGETVSLTDDDIAAISGGFAGRTCTGENTAERVGKCPQHGDTPCR